MRVCLCSHLCDYLICVLTFDIHTLRRRRHRLQIKPQPWPHNEFYELESIINLIRLRISKQIHIHIQIHIRIRLCKQEQRVSCSR